jgi:SAM-dependent MidA family methyltransferase
LSDGTFVPWDVAWHRALYGADGFYRRADGDPASHFRTGVHVSGLLAAALARLARQCGLSRVVDLGSGRGELLNSLSDVDPDLALVGVDVVARPATLTEQARWVRSPGAAALPAAPDVFAAALVVAHEWLDDVPCPVVELDPAGGWRQVEVDPTTGAERLGPVATDDQRAWLMRWWPMGEPGSRAEVGSPRDVAWAQLVARSPGSVLVAVDYSHDRATRPAGGSLAGYRGGRAVRPVPDGGCDVTAHVALDAVARAGEKAGATGTLLTTQHEALRRLGVSARRPDLSSARDDPPGYLAGLRLAGEAAELLDPGGLGSFGWLVQPIGPTVPSLWAGFDSTAAGSRG